MLRQMIILSAISFSFICADQEARDTYEQSKSEYDNAIAIDDIQSIQAIRSIIKL
jgi:hypothetical protein